MTWTSIRSWLGAVIRLFLGGVWLYAALEKLPDPRGFTQAVRAYDATPEWLSKAIGYGLPVLEFCVGLLLVCGVITRVAASVSVALLTVFVIGVAQAAARGIKLECGCFGGGGTTTGATSYTLDILRDVGLIALSVYLVIWPLTRFGVDEYLARNDNVTPPSPKRLRSEQGLRKYNALLEARREAARVRTRYLSGALGAIVVLVSIIGIGVQANRAKIQGDLTATNATVQNGVVVGNKAPVTVDLFEDFQCPICREFENAASADVAAKIKAGTIQARYHMISILDASSNGNRYSSRAANAALCASDISVADFQKYHAVLYGNDSHGNPIQPDEGTNGRTDDDLVNYAKQAGISGSDLTTFTSCVQSEQHKALVSAITDNASKRGIDATPTVLVNGKKLGNPSQQSLDAAITTAAGKAGAHPSSSATSTPTRSPSATATP